MNPSDFSKNLRVIASKLDNSSFPSKKLVVDNLKRLVGKLATRSDVINEIDRKFDFAGIYPPNMREVSPGVFEGEIDTGWVLTVVDSPREIKLNDEVMKSIDDAVKSYNEFKGLSDRFDVSKNFELHKCNLFDSGIADERDTYIISGKVTIQYEEVKRPINEEVQIPFNDLYLHVVKDSYDGKSRSELIAEEIFDYVDISEDDLTAPHWVFISSDVKDQIEEIILKNIFKHPLYINEKSK